ncbi:hypothetical protein QR680_013946 [Steinernema hermaphroditum]|uniref:Metalloendopeptidase n=1 Tax=Steinernema hermaphroditum TaxID=289476 RepID=A0AA39I8M1_9BILA|nr:hypothetical protein QR680_013946 [Steinernema hermaphroditum]
MLQVVVFFLLSAPVLSRVKRGAAINDDMYPSSLWLTSRPIFCCVSSNFDSYERENILYMVGFIQSRSCLHFQYSTDDRDGPLLVFSKVHSGLCHTNGIGRYYPKGFVGVYLTSQCIWGSLMAHELLHALGIEHTMKRRDRDNYITVLLNRTIESERSQYTKTDTAKDFGVPYDFGSSTHYDPYSNSIYDGEPHMIAKNPLFQYSMGLRNFYPTPAHSDLLLLYRLYKCHGRCSATPIFCAYGGYQDPNDCRTCICQEAFSGRFCQEPMIRQADGRSCGGPLYASYEWGTLAVVDFKSYSLCHWHLRTVPGERIEIDLVDVGPSNNELMDPMVILEVQLGKFVISGCRFYRREQLPRYTIVSAMNLAVITFKTVKNNAGYFRLGFRNERPKFVRVRHNYEKVGNSVRNIGHVHAIRQYLRRFTDEEKQNIAIITPYTAQKMLLSSQFKDVGRVNTIDEFQGDEADTIIISLPRRNLAFLHDTYSDVYNDMVNPRLVVMLTRARKEMILFGDDFQSEAKNFQPSINNFLETVETVLP